LNSEDLWVPSIQLIVLGLSSIYSRNKIPFPQHLHPLSHARHDNFLTMRSCTSSFPSFVFLALLSFSRKKKEKEKGKAKRTTLYNYKVMS
jgi:hypothetical protein